MAAVRKKMVSVTNIPELAPPPLLQQTAEDASANRSLLTLNLSAASSSALDPAEMAILRANESKERRKKEETRLELEKIRERIQYTLSEYQPDAADGDSQRPSSKDVDLHAVRSPEELYRMLADVRLRSKYQQHVTVLLLGHEAALADRERLLQSIHEFFQETTAGNTEQMLEEISSQEIDLEEATAGLESALHTAQAAGERLLEIKKDMGQLFAIVQAFPDTKKGRKKLEKALLKAQEEVESLHGQLAGLSGEMEGSRERVARLQKQIDSKMAECEKLKKTAVQVEQLQKTNAGLQSELAAAKDAAGKAKAELERERMQLMSKKEEVREIVREVEVAGDSGRVSELEAALAKEKNMAEEMKVRMEAKEGEFQEKMAAALAEHEAEIQEMRCRYEEQMKSLMEDDMFSDVGSAGEEGDGEEIEGPEEAVDVGVLQIEQDGGGGDEAVDQLKLEHRQRESKLREDLNEVKNKSRKTMTALKAQLAETQNRLSDEKGSLQRELNTLQTEKTSVEAERDRKSEDIASLEERVSSLETQLEEASAREQERATQVNQLQSELQSALAGTVRPARLTELGNRSAQWSDVSPATLTPSHGHTSPPFPVLQMDEVPFSCDPSAAELNHPPFNTGGTPQSVQSHLPGGHTPYSEGSNIPGGTQFFHGSLDQSGSIHHLGESSTAANNGISVPPPHALHMLAQSRLSRYSPQTASLPHDHPVVLEWVKTYDMVMKFRDGMADMLREDERFESEVEEICSIEGVPFDKEEEVHGQVTQMRFSLTLLLHQMEGTLQDTFGKLLRGEGLREIDEDGEEEGEGEVRHLRLAKARLNERLKWTEDTHKMELQESKETIANLSNKVETLRMEVASLRHSMATTNEMGGASNAPLSMFTSLDFSHNTKQLESAVESSKITSEAYQKVREEMRDYLSIPSQRLAQVGKRRQEKQLAEDLVCEVQRELGRDVVERVAKKICSRDQLKQREFEALMEELRKKRFSLAHKLTVKLGEMEEITKSLLIKPIFGAQAQPRHQGLITPLPRPIPLRRVVHAPKPGTRTGSAVVGRAHKDKDYHCHSHLAGTLGERKDSGKPSILTGPSPHLHGSPPSIRERPRGRREEFTQSQQATPLPPPNLRTHPLLGRDTRTPREAQRGSETAWQVEESRPPTRQAVMPFSPLMFHAPPVIPYMMELNSTRKRYLVNLVGELGLSSHSRTTPQPHTEKSSAVQSRLVAHSKTPHTRSLSCPRTSSLPPISVPGPLAPAIY